MDTIEQFLIFTADEQRYALRLANVERVVRAVEVMPLPEASPSVLGVINVQGQIVSVLSLRKQFHLPDRAIELDDRLIMATASQRTIALLVDAVSGVVAIAAQDIVPVSRIAPGMEYSDGMINLADEMVLILKLETFTRSA